MDRDDTMKWIAIMFVGIAIGGAISRAAEAYLKRAEAAEAMKHGYTQDEDGHWVKP